MNASLRRLAAGPVAPVLLAVAATAFLAAGCEREVELEQPVPLYGGEPIEYPVALWDQGAEGETLLRLLVSETGEVDSIEVAQTSGHAQLDSAAVDGARAMSFQPGRKNGKRVPMWATLPVQFSTRPASH